MVSLGTNHRHSGGGYFFNNDMSQIFNETDEASLVSSVLISEEEPHFKTMPITCILFLEILSIIGLVTSSFIVPYYTQLDTSFVLSCLHSGFWCFLFITSGYRNYHHSHIQRCGYLEFYRNTQLLQKLPLLVISLGNTLLVVCLSLFEKYCQYPDNCPVDSRFHTYNYLQTLFAIEACILLPTLIKYISLVMKFNKSKTIPDVHQDELLASYTQSHAPMNEIGFRDEDYLEDVLEKQADMIRYLKQHSNNLSKKIMKLASQLNSGNVQRF